MNIDQHYFMSLPWIASTMWFQFQCMLQCEITIKWCPNVTSTMTNVASLVNHGSHGETWPTLINHGHQWWDMVNHGQHMFNLGQPCSIMENYGHPWSWSCSTIVNHWWLSQCDVKFVECCIVKKSLMDVTKRDKFDGCPNLMWTLMNTTLQLCHGLLV